MRIVILILAFAAVGFADTVRLRDGRVLEGELKKSDAGWRLTEENGKVTELLADQIQSIEPSARKPAGPEEAAAHLASLRRSVENIADLRRIIERFEQFIAQNTDPAATAAAKADLEIWKDRLARGLVKSGGQWVDAQTLAEHRRQAAQRVAEAQKLLIAGRTREAEPILAAVLQDDPENVTALYLRGGLQLAAEQWPVARKTFEAVNAAYPNHAPTLNNLAVINWRQRQYMAAMNFYDAAMSADPVRKEILDNVAEALHALPEEHRNNAITRRTVRRFNEQDTLLTARMAEQGWHRWGAIWLNTEQRESVRQAEKDITDKIDEMKRQFDTAEARIARIDRDLETNYRSMRSIESSNYVQDANGRWYRRPYPPLYWEIDRENEQLKAQRQELTKSLESMRVRARELQQRLPIPRYSGVQRPMGPDAAPMPLPATQPAPATLPDGAGS